MNYRLIITILYYPSLVGFNTALIDRCIQHAINNTVFPGAVLLIGSQNTYLYHKAYGSHTYEHNAPPITTGTLFDCASLTKVIATTTAAMLLTQQKLLSPEDYVSEYIDSFKTGIKSRIQIKDLLTHTSGMPPDLGPAINQFFENPSGILEYILNSQPVYPHGTYIYSCLNFVILTTIIQKVSNQPYIDFVTHHIFQPLGMHTAQFRADVHDPIARIFAAIGQSSGNAGLFCTAHDIALCMQALTKKDNSFIDQSLITDWTTNKIGAANRGYGWAIAPDNHYSCGDYISKNSFGHLGFTGTSIWYDREKNIYVIFLCNRLCPHKGVINGPEQCIAFRRTLHNIIFNPHD